MNINILKLFSEHCKYIVENSHYKCILKSRKDTRVLCLGIYLNNDLTLKNK